MKLHHIAAAIATASLAVASLGAHAVVVDISATSGTFTSPITLDAGTYNFSWIDNTAAGGYAGWSANLSNSAWREAFIVSFSGWDTFTIDKQAGYHYVEVAGATPANALAAFQTGPYAFSTTAYTYPNTSQVFFDLDSQSFTLNSAQSLTFGIPDGWVYDNTGGVSLAITAAVPEPETYALMLAGLGAMGFIARRRKQASV